MAEAGTVQPGFTWGRMASYVKIEHTLFSLPILVSGAVMASSGWPPALRVLVTLVAAAGARAAGMSLNRIVDRAIDARNPRTAMRELPAGTLGMRHAWAVTAVGTAVYLAGAAWLGRLCLLLSPIPLLVFWGYPFLKRFTPLAHFGVGLALCLAPVGAYLAVRMQFIATLREVWPLALFTFLWVSGFDIIYGTLDVAFDRGPGLHSMPADLGVDVALRISGALHLLAWLALAWLTWTRWPHPLPAVWCAACGVLLFLEHRNARDVHLAFFKFNAWLSFVVLALVLAGTFAR